MDKSTSQRNGALPVESRRAGRVPGLQPRRGPPQATGGHPVPVCGARFRKRRKKATGQNKNSPAKNATTPRSLNILQWNAEGVFKKKLPLTERLHQEKIDVACIQETHLNKGHRFQIRGYRPIRMDRDDAHKGGILMLVKNSIPAEEFELKTKDQAEINGAKLTIDDTIITIHNFYCPSDKDLSLKTMDIPDQNSLVIGDFNSHSTCWGYSKTDNRGDEVEDWQVDNRLTLLNDPEDPPTFFSRRWLTTTTPDLAFATDDLAKKTTRTVQKQLGGSDHKPIKLTIDLQYNPQDASTFPRWNYKKADWEMFSSLSNIYTTGVKADDYNVNRAMKTFNQAILKAASESIPRGARKNYRPYWTEELQELEDQVSNARQNLEDNPSQTNNEAYKTTCDQYRKAYTEAAKKSWIEKTEKLNLDKSGHKLWQLTKAMNDETTRGAQIQLKHKEEHLTGQKAANCFIDNYAEVSNINVTKEKKEWAQEEQGKLKKDGANENLMNTPFNARELEDAIKLLNEKKSPGPDKITNEMLKHLGNQAKKKLLTIYNSSWIKGHVPQIWREADMVPILKNGKDRSKVDSYRPISLTSCAGKLLERMINTRLCWFLESNNILAPEQAGFRPHRSTEDQVTYIAQKIEDGFQEKKHTLTIWVDLEKAFDRVWKNGLRIKLLKSGISGCMYQWISQYLNNRKARVHVNGAYSRKKTLKEGVPQGGVLSPTLFLIFINDIVKELPKMSLEQFMPMIWLSGVLRNTLQQPTTAFRKHSEY